MTQSTDQQSIGKQPTGKAYLVGSGPGDIAYLTVRGQQLLTQTEVLIYDALVDETLLQWVPANCLKLDVGKRGGQPSTPQAVINQYLVTFCQQGKQVVRLKSGDPFIFGRCTAEIQALVAARCDFEVVPGISSALAAPLLAGIPLTDPVLSRCFAVLSAHEPDALDWEALARLETLVILMGGQCLPEIVAQLLRHGRSPQTPIAIIRWAGQPRQHLWMGTLASIVQQTSRQPLSPAVITIGEVVGLRSYLQSPHPSPFPHPSPLPIPPIVSSFAAHPSPTPPLPLTGKTILITRAAGQSGQFTTLLEAQGAQVLEMPALEIGPPSSWDGLDGAIAHLSTFDWLILTSTNGVDYFFERLAAQGKDARALAGVKIAVVGQKTAASLRTHGLQPDFIPPAYVADALVEHFPEVDRLSELTILFPRVETGGREVLVNELTAKGAHVTEVAAYQSGCAKSIPADIQAALQTHAIDIVTFASSKTVKCFCQLCHTVGLLTPEQWADVYFASIGPQTSADCQRLLGRVDIEASEYTLEGLTQAIVQWATSSVGKLDRAELSRENED